MKSEKVIYVSLDGCLIEKLSIPESESDKFAYYQSHIESASLAIYPEILNLCKQYKAEGYTLILWSNRSATLESATRATLGESASLFDDMQFLSGNKKVNPDMIVIDCHPRFTKKNPLSVLVKNGEVVK
jgi:hypothetical protein